MAKISIIVPVYNTAKYLERCVDSIVAQTYADWELLLVDDGSTDRSGDICDRYAASDPRIQVFHKPNGGVSSARNLGLDHAKGEWITFVDSDDKVKNTLCEIIYDYSTKNSQCEILRYGYGWGKESSNTATISDKEYRLNNKEEIIKTCDEVYYFEMIWNAAFKAELVKDIRFDTNIDWSEDFLFMYECVSKCKEVYIINQALYHYFDTPNSLKKRIKSIKNRIYSIGLNITAKCALLHTAELIDQNLSKYSHILTTLITEVYKDKSYTYTERNEARTSLGNICDRAKKGVVLKVFEKVHPFFLADALLLFWFRTMKMR